MVWQDIAAHWKFNDSSGSPSLVDEVSGRTFAVNAGTPQLGVGKLNGCATHSALLNLFADAVPPCRTNGQLPFDLAFWLYVPAAECAAPGAMAQVYFIFYEEEYERYSDISIYAANDGGGDYGLVGYVADSAGDVGTIESPFDITPDALHLIHFRGDPALQKLYLRVDNVQVDELSTGAWGAVEYQEGDLGFAQVILPNSSYKIDSLTLRSGSLWSAQDLTDLWNGGAGLDYGTELEPEESGQPIGFNVRPARLRRSL